MNIFYLDQDPRLCASYHCDKHVVKMIVEYAQLLCTTHRVVDGTKQTVTSNNRKKQMYLLDGESIVIENAKAVIQNATLYNATHVNHPCNIWLRESRSNYILLLEIFENLLCEYTFRYGKIHATGRLLDKLKTPPVNLCDAGITAIAQAMPEQYQQTDPVEAYRAFYRGDKSKFAKWTKREKPSWF